MQVGGVAAGVGAAAAALVSVVALAVGPAGAQPTTVFSSDAQGLIPGAYAVTVPAGVCFVTISADGGHGGTNASFTTAPGGTGATVSIRVAVTPGETLGLRRRADRGIHRLAGSGATPGRSRGGPIARPVQRPWGIGHHQQDLSPT